MAHKTPKPLTIVVIGPTCEWEEWDKLEKQGHHVIKIPNTEHEEYLGEWFVNADLIIGSNCWRMTGLHKAYLPLAIKEARMIKYQSNEERADIKLRNKADKDLNLEGEESE